MLKLEEFEVNFFLLLFSNDFNFKLLFRGYWSFHKLFIFKGLAVSGHILETMGLSKMISFC